MVFDLSRAGAEGDRNEPGVSVVVVNLLNARPDCSPTPGPVILPNLLQKPANGIMQMQVVIADVPATSTCPARKVPAIALVYTPRKNSTGTDAVEIEVDTDNRVAYRISVGATAEPL